MEMFICSNLFAQIPLQNSATSPYPLPNTQFPSFPIQPAHKFSLAAMLSRFRSRNVVYFPVSLFALFKCRDLCPALMQPVALRRACWHPHRRRYYRILQRGVLSHVSLCSALRDGVLYLPGSATVIASSRMNPIAWRKNRGETTCGYMEKGISCGGREKEIYLHASGGSTSLVRWKSGSSTVRRRRPRYRG